jgi:hypothetical protein
MITLKEFMEVIDYRITEGSDFTWTCFGNEAKPYTLSAWNQEQDGWSFNITFDTVDQTVYMVEVCDYKNQRAYRRINPDWQKSYDDYAERHTEYADQAWDDVNYIDLDVDDDWIQKSLAIKAGEDYDTRVSVPVEFTDEELLKYMTMAHERDMTFNQFIEEALRHALEEHKRDPEGFLYRAKNYIETPCPTS